MSKSNSDTAIDSQVDKALADLPRDVEFTKDLWPSIRAQIAAESPTEAQRDIRSATSNRLTDNKRFSDYRFLGQLAAGLVLVVITATITYQVTRPPATIVANNTVANSVDEAALDANYLKARAELDRLFAERIAALPVQTRTKLLANLADLRRASDEITATLAQHPADPLLQDLLISTRQRELRLLADVSQLNISDSQRTAS